jgi:catechol 2,3-dioxygenase-like lactoylglutathione lyase family enzyme
MIHPRRTEAIAIHSASRFAFSVPDLSVAERYFSAFGLRVERSGDRLRLYTFFSPHCWGEVFQGGTRKKFMFLTLGAYAEDMEALQRKVLQCGHALADPHPIADDKSGFWVRDPDGNLLQITVTEKVTPNEKTPALGPIYKLNPIHVPIGPMRGELPQIRPLRLSHILMFTTDVARSIDFYGDALGLRLSDKSADVIAFMHGAHASDHHLLAFAKSNGPGLHHTSWAVDCLDHVGLGMEQMVAAGHTRGWGLGRHVIGSNYFYYVQDPWGSFTEYSFDIDFVGHETDWPAQDYPPENSLYLWGPSVPEDFITNHEVDPSVV